jgi:hypothetical protein
MWRRIAIVLGIVLFPLFAFGEYTIVTDHFHYSGKDIAIGLVAWPYPMWVTGQQIYRLATTTQTQRDIEHGCLEASVTEQIPLRQAVFICKCMMTKEDFSYCSVLATGEH